MSTSATRHFVNGNSLQAPWPNGSETAVFGLGCFWGAERIFWQMPGVYSTAVGYAGGDAGASSYEQVCSGSTGHAEVVLVVFDPALVTYKQLLKVFWESHNPTQGMRQGNDVGTQYRSAIYTASEAQNSAALETQATYQQQLSAAGHRQSRPKSPPPRSFIMPRITTSSTWPRIQTAIAASAAPVCRAQSRLTLKAIK